jgi:transcriptional regulator, MerR family
VVKQNSTESSLPPIPPKHYFTIGEVSQLCDIKPHVLRYWEQEFLQLRQVKRRGNRRYYQPREVELIRYIRSLLYERGFTITGARHELSQQRFRGGSPISGEASSILSEVAEQEEALKQEENQGAEENTLGLSVREELEQIVLLLSR